MELGFHVYHSCFISISELSGRLLSVQVNVLFTFVRVTVSDQKKKKKGEKMLYILLVLYHLIHCLMIKELSAESSKRGTKTQAKRLTAVCVQFLTPRLLKSSYSQL